MKQSLMVLTLCTVLTLLLGASPVAAQTPAAAPLQEPYGGTALCLPDIYLQTPIECLPLGPSGFLTEMAKKGITFPPRPIPASHPGPQYDVVDAKYAKISLPNEERAPVFPTLDAAVSGENPSRYIDPGLLRYMSYTSQQDVDGKHFILLKSGEWMRASPAGYTSFQGWVLHGTLRNTFGWIVDQAEVRAAPGYKSPVVDATYPRGTLVQVYDTQKVNDTDWYMVDADQWIEHRYIRKVDINATPPKGVENNRWIEVNLYQQTLIVYDQGKPVFATLIASGVEPFWTRPGLFKIFKKKPLETMSGAFEAGRTDYYYLEDVPWTMYYDEGRALHGAYWRALFGYPQSHGCVNLSVGDSRWLYDWAKEGDWVYVWDPSGQTPTDPKTYGKGGA
jgi:lipoprotein-anchoring transpeptidase ErfK/SrfK